MEEFIDIDNSIFDENENINEKYLFIITCALTKELREIKSETTKLILDMSNSITQENTETRDMKKTNTINKIPELLSEINQVSGIIEKENITPTQLVSIRKICEKCTSCCNVMKKSNEIMELSSFIMNTRLNDKEIQHKMEESFGILESQVIKSIQVIEKWLLCVLNTDEEREKKSLHITNKKYFKSRINQPIDNEFDGQIWTLSLEEYASIMINEIKSGISEKSEKEQHTPNNLFARDLNNILKTLSSDLSDTPIGDGVVDQLNPKINNINVAIRDQLQSFGLKTDIETYLRMLKLRNTQSININPTPPDPSPVESLFCASGSYLFILNMFTLFKLLKGSKKISSFFSSMNDPLHTIDPKLIEPLYDQLRTQYSHNPYCFMLTTRENFEPNVRKIHNSLCETLQKAHLKISIENKIQKQKKIYSFYVANDDYDFELKIKWFNECNWMTKIKKYFEESHIFFIKSNYDLSQRSESSQTEPMRKILKKCIKRVSHIVLFLKSFDTHDYHIQFQMWAKSISTESIF